MLTFYTAIVLILTFRAHLSSGQNLTLDREDVCLNSCRLLIPYDDFLHTCTCNPTDNNEQCMYGCQTVRCTCRGIPGKYCQLWCLGYSEFHGCDCSRTWDLKPLPEPTSASILRTATTRGRMTFTTRRAVFSVTTKSSQSDYRDDTPVIVGSTVGAMVVVILVIVFMIAYTQHFFTCCLKSSHVNEMRPSHSGNSPRVNMLQPVRAMTSAIRSGVVSHSPNAGSQSTSSRLHFLRRAFSPPPTPSAPPSYEESMRQIIVQLDSSNDRANGRPPEYSSIVAENRSPRVAESSV